MGELNIKVTIYSRHTSGYSSYKGNIGKKAPNILKQEFKETKPLKVLHTDVTQVRLQKGKWGYISAVLDQASGEILSHSVSSSPNELMIKDTLDKLKKMNIKQSMSRKGNCHDNAPIESFFNLLKRECLYRYNILDLDQLRQLVDEYINWYNNDRISLKRKGLSPVEYRKQSIVS